MTRPRRDDCHANITAAWSIACLVLVLAVATVVALLAEAY